MRDYTLTIEYVPAQPYLVVQSLYNSSYHTDMKQTGHGELDNVSSWLDGARSFMKQPPWGQIPLKGACLEEVKEIGNLALVDASRVPRAIKNSLYLESLIASIDRCIEQHREPLGAGRNKNAPIFCRLNECSMKQFMSYAVQPFRNGDDIVNAILKDRRLILWLRMPKYDIRSTMIYLSDFDDAIASKNEYRVFVWKGRVTGISQYRWFVVDETEYHEEESARSVCAGIVQFMEGEEGLLPHMVEYRRKTRTEGATPVPQGSQSGLAENVSEPVQSTSTEEGSAQRQLANDEDEQKHDEDELTLVADVVHTEGRVYLIEINLFGGDTGCGSSLFHWKCDEEALYGDGQNIICRFLAR